MRRVVALFVGILSVVWATPFDIGSFDRPNPFRDNVEFGNDAFSEDSDYKYDYEIGTFKSGENSNFIDESDKIGSRQGLVDLFGHLLDCELVDNQNPPQEGCVLVAGGDVYFIHVLFAVNVEDVYKAFRDAGIEECEVGEDVNDVPEGECFRIDEESASVTWFGAYDRDIVDEVIEIDDIKDIMSNIEKCDVTATEVPEKGCALLDENGLHLINVLTEDNIDDAMKALNEIGYIECTFDEDHVLIIKDPCYEINKDINGIDFFNLPDDDDDYDYSEQTYNIPDEVVSPPSSIQTGNGHLNLKGLFNQQSSVAKKAKAFHAKKIQSRKQPQEVQKILGRRGHQHGNNAQRVNQRPKWMKYLQTNQRLR